MHIANLFFDSHGRLGEAQIEIGNTRLLGAQDILNDLDIKSPLNIISKYTNSKTKVILGSCWGGMCKDDQGSQLANELSEALNGATVYSYAGVADSRTLWESGNLTSDKSFTLPGGYAQGIVTQVNTGTWYKAINGTGNYINGYVRIGNAGKIIEKRKPFLGGWIKRKRAKAFMRISNPPLPEEESFDQIIRRNLPSPIRN